MEERRGKRGAPSFVVVVLALVAIAGVVASITFWIKEDIAKDALTVLEATVATGRCGDQQIVVIDEKRVAVAGHVYSSETVSLLRFEGGKANLRVFSERGDLIMERQSR